MAPPAPPAKPPSAKGAGRKRRSDESSNAAVQSTENASVPASKRSSAVAAAAVFPTVNQDIYGTPIIDIDKATNWIYPTNFPRREYQFNIVHKALFQNVLVSLPTGLGKTFIAAVVMYNFYRWFPDGKVVFMAPTRHLVNQQIKACYEITGIPQSDIAELTGQNVQQKRKHLWYSKRVFFVTPQVLGNDIASGNCPAKAFVCLVVDEAHRAQGNHAYCTVVKQIAAATPNFRVLALSASPANDLPSVQAVISNLLISHIELRSEQDIDVREYTHQKHVEEIPIALTEELKLARDILVSLVKIPLSRLMNAKALYGVNPDNVNQMQLVMAQRKFRERPTCQPNEIGLMVVLFTVAISLTHMKHTMLTHGLKTCQKLMQEFEVKARDGGGAYKEIINRPEWKRMQQLFDEHVKTMRDSHPKMAKVEEILVQHFTENEDSRAMVFSHYRHSVNEIAELLQNQPKIRVMTFVGHASGNTKGISQKEQLKIVKEFRDGGYNCLVATCIGEEGLDIGEVDLIVCFDAQQSPIRMVQRLGRTGRKREGKCIILATHEIEDSKYRNSKAKKQTLDRAILEKKKGLLTFYEGDCRLIPAEIKPTVLLQQMVVAAPYQSPHHQRGRSRVTRSAEDDEQKEDENYFNNNYMISSSQLPPLLSQQVPLVSTEPTPVHEIRHSGRSLVMFNLIHPLAGEGDEEEFVLPVEEKSDRLLAADPSTLIARSKAVSKASSQPPKYVLSSIYDDDSNNAAALDDEELLQPVLPPSTLSAISKPPPSKPPATASAVTTKITLDDDGSAMVDGEALLKEVYRPPDLSLFNLPTPYIPPPPVFKPLPQSVVQNKPAAIPTASLSPVALVQPTQYKPAVAKPALPAPKMNFPAPVTAAIQSTPPPKIPSPPPSVKQPPKPIATAPSSSTVPSPATVEKKPSAAMHAAPLMPNVVEKKPAAMSTLSSASVVTVPKLPAAPVAQNAAISAILKPPEPSPLVTPQATSPLAPPKGSLLKALASDAPKSTTALPLKPAPPVPSQSAAAFESMTPSASVFPPATKSVAPVSFVQPSTRANSNAAASTLESQSTQNSNKPKLSLSLNKPAAPPTRQTPAASSNSLLLATVSKPPAPKPVAKPNELSVAPKVKPTPSEKRLTTGSEIECPICNLKFDNERVLGVHVDDAHKPDNDDDELVPPSLDIVIDTGSFSKKPAEKTEKERSVEKSKSGMLPPATPATAKGPSPPHNDNSSPSGLLSLSTSPSSATPKPQLKRLKRRIEDEAGQKPQQNKEGADAEDFAEPQDRVRKSSRVIPTKKKKPSTKERRSMARMFIDDMAGENDLSEAEIELEADEEKDSDLDGFIVNDDNVEEEEEEDGADEKSNESNVIPDEAGFTQAVPEGQMRFIYAQSLLQSPAKPKRIVGTNAIHVYSPIENDTPSSLISSLAETPNGSVHKSSEHTTPRIGAASAAAVTVGRSQKRLNFEPPSPTLPPDEATMPPRDEQQENDGDDEGAEVPADATEAVEEEPQPSNFENAAPPARVSKTSARIAATPISVDDESSLADLPSMAPQPSPIFVLTDPSQSSGRTPRPKPALAPPTKGPPVIDLSGDTSAPTKAKPVQKVSSNDPAIGEQRILVVPPADESSEVVAELQTKYKQISLISRPCCSKANEYILTSDMCLIRKAKSDFSSERVENLKQQVANLLMCYSQVLVLVEDFPQTTHDQPGCDTETGEYQVSIIKGVRLVYSFSASDSAQLIAGIVQDQKRPLQLDMERIDRASDVMMFLLQAPRLSYPMAASLVSNFSSLREILGASISELQTRASLPQPIALAFQKFSHHTADHEKLKLAVDALPVANSNNAHRLVNPLQPSQPTAPVQNPFIAARAAHQPPAAKKPALTLRLPKK